ncbi:HAD family hydrolase [Mycoplasma sp. 6243]|uniref:HAD family hydrolase n=1 Tax=Mycoplasma sp. 6243 TaxID=3440865 RepID=UPI003EBD5C3E
MDKLKNSDFEYLFFDLDGTLLDSHKNITPQSYQGIQRMRSLGKKYSVITGRPHYLAKEEFFNLDCDYPAICCNGSLIYDFQNDQIVYKNPINKASAKAVFEALIASGVVFLVYTCNQIYGFHKNVGKPSWFAWLEETIAKRRKENQFAFDYYDLNHQNPNFNTDEHDILKFLVIKRDSTAEKTDISAMKISKIDNVYIINSQVHVYDIMPINNSKGKSLQILADKYNIDLNKTLVFGDEDNDVSMFEVAKYSVAMGQARDEVKSKATFITNSHDEQGIANFLNMLE